MSVEVHDYASVAGKLREFGLSAPQGLALLPDNLAMATSRSELRQQVEADTVRTLLRINGIHHEEVFGREHQPAYLEQYAHEWFGPTIYVAFGMMSSNPDIISIVTNLISNYLYDFFKGKTKGKVSLNVIYENADGTCKRIEYSGTAEGMNAIPKIIREINQP